MSKISFAEGSYVKTSRIIICSNKFTFVINGSCLSESFRYSSWDYGPPKEYHSEAPKPLTQSGSAAGRRPSLVLTQWPSSSTLCRSDSLRMSEISINMEGYQQGLDVSTPQPQQHSPLVYEYPKHHSFSGGDLISVRPDSSTISNFTEPKLISNHRRGLIMKFKSLPKLMPVKKSGSAGSNSRAKKGVRWKPLTEPPSAKSVDSSGLEMEKMCSSTSGIKYKYPMSRDTPDVKFTGFEFPVVKTRFTESLYCDLCQQKVCHILSSPNPEKVGYEINLKHSISAPLIVSDHAGNSCGHDRDHSWQNKFTDKYTTRRESSPGTRLEYEPEVTECTSFSSQSVPNITFGENSSLPIKSQELGKTDSDFAPSVCASKEHLRGNVSSLHNSALPEIPTVKTSLVTNPELQMDASFPPTYRKDSDILSESSLDAASWKSADWTTLLGSDVLSS